MSRIKKKRSFVSQYMPAPKVESKAERLLDEDSYESRKKRGQDKKKKHKSVYQKTVEQEKAGTETLDPQAARKGGRLADKIRAMNKAKDEQAKSKQDTDPA